MRNESKVKQVVVRFDKHSHNLIKKQAEIEHRGIGEFVRHATLDYIERIYQSMKPFGDK